MLRLSMSALFCLCVSVASAQDLELPPPLPPVPGVEGPRIPIPSADPFEAVPIPKKATVIREDVPPPPPELRMETQRSEFVRSMRLKRGVTRIHWVCITVTSRDEVQKTVRGLLHQPDHSQMFVWPVSDAVFEDLKMGPNGEATRYHVFIVHSPQDNRKAILGVYEGREILLPQPAQQEVNVPTLAPIPVAPTPPTDQEFVPVLPRKQN